MKLSYIKVLLASLTLIFILLFTSCGAVSSSEADACTTASDLSSDTAESSSPEPTVEIKTIYSLVYVEPRYLSDEEKEAWRAPLTALIANMKEAVVEDFDIVGYEAPDPSLPSIENGRNFGLMDLDLDGVPELFVDLGGGSSGNSYYYVYDILSGDFLGSYNGGKSGSIAAYLDCQTGAIDCYSSTQYRIGALGRTRSVERLTLAEDVYEKTKTVYAYSCFSAYYSFDILYDAAYGYDERYSEATYFVDGATSSWDAYYDAHDDFYSNHMRIPDTSFVLIYGYDVYDYEDDRFERAEELVDALLSSEQKFLSVDTNIEGEK